MIRVSIHVFVSADTAQYSYGILFKDTHVNSHKYVNKNLIYCSFYKKKLKKKQVVVVMDAQKIC